MVSRQEIWLNIALLQKYEDKNKVSGNTSAEEVCSALSPCLKTKQQINFPEILTYLAIFAQKYDF